jgi:hypothetical protein
MDYVNVSISDAYRRQIAAASQSEQNARSKFAVHSVLLAVKSILAKEPNAFGPSIAAVVAEHVVPDFQSPFAFLRGKACEVNQSAPLRILLSLFFVVMRFVLL